MRFLCFLVVGYFLENWLWAAESGNRHSAGNDGIRLLVRADQQGQARPTPRWRVPYVSILNVGGFFGFGRYAPLNQAAAAKGGISEQDVRPVVDTGAISSPSIAPTEDAGESELLFTSRGSGDSSVDARAIETIQPVTVSASSFGMSSFDESHRKEGSPLPVPEDDDWEEMFKGMVPYLLEEEEELRRQQELQKSAEDARKKKEQLQLAALEEQLINAQIARMADWDAPRKRGKASAVAGIKLGRVPFLGPSVLAATEGACPASYMAQEDKHTQSAAAILWLCNQEEIAKKMDLPSKDIEAVFPIIQSVHRFVAPRLASCFFIMVRLFITNYSDSAEKQRKLTVLLSNILRMGGKITIEMQSNLSTGISDRISNFDNLVEYMQSWQKALKSDAENGKTTPNQC